MELYLSCSNPSSYVKFYSNLPGINELNLIRAYPTVVLIIIGIAVVCLAVPAFVPEAGIVAWGDRVNRDMQVRYHGSWEGNWGLAGLFEYAGMT